MNTAGTILVVDDTQANLQVLVRILTADGHQVLPADSGTLAMDAVAAGRPDLILLDIRMPEPDGLAVCRWLKSRPETRDIPVIFISASDDHLERLEGLRLGAVDFVAKPFEEAELLARVHTHLALRRLQVAAERQAVALRESNRQLQVELTERQNAEARERALHDASRETYRSTLNLMADVVEARNRLQTANAELMAEVTERRAAEAGLRFNEEMLELTGAMARVGAWELDLATGQLWWSKETYQIHEVEDHDVRNLPDGISFYAPEAQPVIAAAVAEGIAHGTPWDLELPFVTAKGHHRWVRAQGAALLADGTPVKLRGAFHDITDRWQAQQALRENEEHLRLAIESGKHGTYDLNLVTGEAITSPLYATMLGYSPGEYHLTTASWAEQLHPADRERCVGVLKSCTEGSAPAYRMEYRLRTKSGEWKWLLSLGQVVERDSTGRARRMMGTHTDISAIKETEAVLAMQAQRAKVLLELPRAADQMTEREFMVYGLEQAEALTSSPVSFIHFVDEDKQMIQMAAWSRSTLASYCTSAFESHAPLGQAGIWADACRQRRPVVFNDYEHDPAAHGLPVGHAALHRLLSVPVIEGGKVQMITGVGNRDAEYSGTEVETVQLLSEEIWRLVRRRRDEAAVRASEEHFRSLFVLNPHPMWLYDSASRLFLSVNEAAIALYGYSEAEFQAMQVEDLLTLDHLLDGDEGRAVRTELRQAMDAASNASRVWRHHTKDGSLIDVEIVSRRMDEAAPNIRLALAQNVTERTATAREIAELNERLREHAASLERRVAERTAELEATNSELESFASSVSHDLRAPLRAMQGFGEALRTDYATTIDAQGKHYIERIQTAATRMAQLIDDLLNLSRIMRTDLFRRRVNLSSIAHEIVEELKARDPARRIEVRIADAMVVDGDARLLRIVLQNLLDNAWKFTGTREVGVVEVGVVAGEDAGSPEYFVRDNGVGFDMAYAHKLFTPFQRLHGATEFPGTGIGLATVQRVIVRHGGSVRVQATPDQGATVFFTLAGGSVTEAEAPNL